MKRPISLVLVFLVFASMLCSGEAHAGKKKNMREFFDKKHITKAYVPDVVNSSEYGNVDTAGLKKSIEDALVTRQSHKFEIVSGKSDADIVVDIEVVEYLFTEEDPVDMVFSPIAAAADAARREPYTRMQAVFSIVDMKKGSVIWQEDLQSTITHAAMTEQKSYGMSNERMTEVFLKELFKKPKRR